MEWVRFVSIARQPVPPDEQLKDVTPAVSAIILKLLAKTAEERATRRRPVSSAACGFSRTIGSVNIASINFPLGQQDTPDRLRIPEKLYGRTRRVEILFASFRSHH